SPAMHPSFVTGVDTAYAIPIWFVNPSNMAEVRVQFDAPARDYITATAFEPKPGRHLLLPGADGVQAVLFGIEVGNAPSADPFLPGRLADLLPRGTYRFANAPNDPRLAALAFALSAYRFGRYRKIEDRAVRL